MADQELIPHLFRTEYHKIISVLCQHFGLQNIQWAEDIVSDTFLAAAETWGQRGLPPNPVAWLYAVAKNKARDQLRRSSLFRGKIVPILNRESCAQEPEEIDLSGQAILDRQLKILFALCHPLIPQESQIGLSLQILCGFGYAEIAEAFLTSPGTTAKRLLRAKEKIRKVGIKMAYPPERELNSRLDPVLRTLYLLFNEGYYSRDSGEPVRQDLCLEAMRLCQLLLLNPATAQPKVHALLALMNFHASRLKARTDELGAAVLYEDQDTGLWDRELIARGISHLEQSAAGEELSKYHLEAAIAFAHTLKEDTQKKWEQILQSYDRLLSLEYSPVIALNRAYALARARGKEEALGETLTLNLQKDPHYHALLGYLYTGRDNRQAVRHWNQAIRHARSEGDRAQMDRKIRELRPA